MANAVHSKKMTLKSVILRLFFITIGALIFSVGLEQMLLPNNMLDGGVVGISILISNWLNTKFGYVLFIIHLPFFYFGFKQMGKWFAIFVGYGVTVVSLASSAMHHNPALSDDPLLAMIFGGILVGSGVGIAVRAGGCLDGMEIVAIYISKRTPFSVGEVLMVINVLIFSTAALTFGWESALYSIVSFFIASKAINVVVEGLNDMKEVTIITDNHQAIGAEIQSQMERTYTLLEAKGGYSSQPKTLMIVYVSRLEESDLRSLVHGVDSTAIMAVSSVSDLRGGRFGFGDH